MMKHPLCTCPRVVQLDLEGDRFPFSWENITLISIVTVEVCAPTAMYVSVSYSLFLLTQASICCVGVTFAEGWLRWNLNVVLIFNSLMMKDVELFFDCFSVTWVSAFENSLFTSVLIFNWIFCFLDISYWVLYWPLAVDQIWSW